MGKKGLKKVLGIDPGIYGAFVYTDGEEYIRSEGMPVDEMNSGKFINFERVYKILESGKSVEGVFLEKPVSFGMGTKSAFNYGRGYELIRIALNLLKIPFTLVEPAKWAKEMHAGLDKNLKPKAKSLIAVERLYPKLVEKLPRKKNGLLLDGPVDALLIAGYGLRQLRNDDFF